MYLALVDQRVVVERAKRLRRVSGMPLKWTHDSPTPAVTEAFR
jgi:hypothetical protein